MNAITRIAKEKMPAGWEVRMYEAIPGGILVTGAVPVGIHLSGRRKGRRKFGPTRDDTRCVVTHNEIAAAVIVRREADTGNCHECDGSGASSGFKSKPCPRCHGTGKPPEVNR